MGNIEKMTPEQDETSTEILKQKNDLSFKQVDFIREIEGSIEDQYELLTPCLEQNEYYELRKAIHIKTKLIRKAYIINKYKIRTIERQLLELQINRLKKLDHPGLLKIYELFKNSHRFFIVLEYSSSESLSAWLQKHAYFDESSAASIMFQLLTLLRHCHQKGIVHGDLKLESICFNSKKQETIKVEDFCISRIFKIEEILDQTINKAFISSPESLANLITTKSDIWSVGIILYILLTGQPLLLGCTKAKMIQKLKHFNLKFKEKRCAHLSHEAKDFLRRILKINPHERPSADELVQHAWIQKYYSIPKVPLYKMMRCMKELERFQCSSKLQEATWTFLVNALISFEEKQLILSTFNILDKESKGEVNQQDIYQAYLQLLTPAEAEAHTNTIIAKFPKKSIALSEFITCCANRFFLITPTNLSQMFKIFDEDNSGEITVSELRDTLGNSKEINQEIWLQLMREADSNSDGRISYEEFKEMIEELNSFGEENDRL